MSFLSEKDRARISVRAEEPGAKLQVNVVYTTKRETLLALRRAAELATNLQGEVHVIVPQVVPYPLPLEQSPVSRGFVERHCRALISQTSVPTHIRPYLCRDREEILLKILPPNSIVVIASVQRWWPTREMWLAGKLRKTGLTVIVVDPKKEL